jgi:hypothetical protein
VSGALLSVLVFAVACAANPWGIMIAVLLLQARRRHVVWAYVLAWVCSLLVGLALLVAGFGAVVASGSDGAATVTSIVELVLGGALLAWGIERTVEDRRDTRGMSAVVPTVGATPSWMRAIDNFSYVPAFLLGIYSATWPMVIAAAGEIVQADGTKAQTVALCVLFIVVGSSTVISVAAVGTFSHRSDELLARLRAWLTLHSRRVITAILLAAGTLLLARGVSGLV